MARDKSAEKKMAGFLEKLLDRGEVEWIELGGLCENISSGKNKEKSDDGLYPVFGSTGVIGRTNKKVYEIEQILIARVGANAGRVNVAEGEYDVSDNTLIVKNKGCARLKYLYYYLVNINLNQFAQGAGQPLITAKQLKALKIPVPCPDNPEKSLEIQAEIVRILDAFTELTTELTTELIAELSLRKKQYSYYRDQLLSFEEGEVEWDILGEMAENHDSKRKPITSGLREKGAIPYYGASGIVDYVKDYIFDGDYLLVSEDGANLLARATPIAFSISGKTWVNNHAHVLRFETYAERKYAEYYLNSIDLAPYISGAAQPKLNKRNLNAIKMPNPPLHEKERIVTILDKFDTITSSIAEGLPREIGLRQKQYKYYRDLLLSFPKSDAEEAA